ncbi:MAG: hypothetical protein M3P34_09310, partial [Actinomycetota bacterium]|nr:hypothetical protein [Actinomycetota bacterium]
MRALLVALTLLSGFAGAVVDEAGAALRRDPVFVHPEASAKYTLSGDEANRLRDRIRSGGKPVFVAVLPDAAEDEAGGINGLPAALGDATGLRGTYAVVTGTGFRAASNALPRGMAGELAGAAFQARKSAGSYAVLEEFVNRVATADAGST